MGVHRRGSMIATADGGASWTPKINGNDGLMPSPVIAASFFDSGGGWIARLLTTGQT